MHKGHCSWCPKAIVTMPSNRLNQALCQLESDEKVIARFGMDTAQWVFCGIKTSKWRLVTGLNSDGKWYIYNYTCTIYHYNCFRSYFSPTPSQGRRSRCGNLWPAAQRPLFMRSRRYSSQTRDAAGNDIPTLVSQLGPARALSKEASLRSSPNLWFRLSYLL